MPKLPRAEAWLLIVFGLALALRLALNASEPGSGLRAMYWAGSSTAGQPERSTEFKDLDNGTRIDQWLDLRGDEFPVHFFNDTRRFNFGLEPQPGRDQLSFSVRWEGWLTVPSDGERRFELEAMGAARVLLDDAEVMRTEAGGGRQVVGRAVPVAEGQRALRVEYVRPEARVPRLRLSWQRQLGAELEAVGGQAVRWRADAAPVSIPTWPSEALAAVALMTLIGSAIARRTEHRLLAAAPALLPLVFLAHGLALHASLMGRTSILSGLDDWLVYESSARDILLHGWLMDGGQGRAPAFYGQPLYPYALALVHALTGESLLGPLALQFAALGLVVALTAVLAWRAFGTQAAALAALGGMWLFVAAQPEHFRVARQLFTENLYMPLVMLSLIVLVGLARRRTPPAWWTALLVGMLLGVTAITRSQFLVFVFCGIVLLALAWRRRGAGALAVLMAGVMLAIAPVTARNWLVAGEFVPISASGGASLLEFHRPPPGLIDQATLQTDPIFEALRLDMNTRTVLAFARQDPLGYLRTLLPLGAHSLGLPGRVSSGVYWPFVLATVLYVSAFALPSARRLHVWPIHAFVGSHLLILMLFEADTYGYRLVVPMYAPMLAVAAQLPLALLSRLPRSTARVAWAAPAALVAGAVLLQARGLIEAWPDRATTVRGLGGPAAVAASAAEQANADVVYVASIDGTPRRFGAGSLPGLHYPWIKWFDPTRSLPLASSTAVYALHELAGQTSAGDLTACLGPPTAAPVILRGTEVRERCARGTRAVGATFDGVARVDAIALPSTVEAGDSLEARLVWQPLTAHPEPYQTWLHVLERNVAPSGVVWGNATLELYPARLWEPNEAVVSRLPVATDATAIPDDYDVVLGMGPLRANAAPLAATWRGERMDRVPVATVTLVPTRRELALAQIMPPDMHLLQGQRLEGGGLELIATRPPDGGDVWPGKRLRFGLLWLAKSDAPEPGRFWLRLVTADGAIVQEAELPLLGGRISPSRLRSGTVVRDEQEFEIAARASGEGLRVEIGLNEEAVVLGRLNVAGRTRAFGDAAEPGEAVFGGGMTLVRHRIERSGDKLSVNMRWRGEEHMERAYKIFVHVLDPSGQRVVAQRDAEPQDGRAPTSSWLPGEVLEDDFEVQLPAGLAPGEYPIEIGVYEERSGTRLLLADGANHFLLEPSLQIR